LVGLVLLVLLSCSSDLGVPSGAASSSRARTPGPIRTTPTPTPIDAQRGCRNDPSPWCDPDFLRRLREIENRINEELAHLVDDHGFDMGEVCDPDSARPPRARGVAPHIADDHGWDVGELCGRVAELHYGYSKAQGS
jgi:hypothetical protein